MTASVFSRTYVLAALIAACSVSSLPAWCGESASLTRQYSEAKDLPASASASGSTLASGAKVLEERLASAPQDQEARFGQGLLQFARAIERFGQAQYRYGLRTPRGLPIPLLRLPVPNNPTPETLTYETQRSVLQALIDDLQAVDRVLEPVDDDSVKIVIDLNAVQLNLTGSATPTPDEKLGSIIAALRSPRPQVPSQLAAPLQPMEVAFDRADALWLRGYCHLLSALVEFTLAYDWHESFNEAGPLFYPRTLPQRFPGQIEASKAGGLTTFGDGGTIADLVALVHTIHWELVEPARLARVHAHLKNVTALSRQSWKAILAETDDDREWIPGPQQKNAAIAIQPVTREIVEGWLSALDDFDAVLDGRKLIPHWRFNGGINFRKALLEPRPFDLIYWATGPGAVPYIEQGEVLSGETLARWRRIFNGNFFQYAAWFN